MLMGGIRALHHASHDIRPAAGRKLQCSGLWLYGVWQLMLADDIAKSGSA
jgi:hypothetical protein